MLLKQREAHTVAYNNIFTSSHTDETAWHGTEEEKKYSAEAMVFVLPLNRAIRAL